MTIDELLKALSARHIRLRRSGSDLVVCGNPEVLDVPLVSELRRHKSTLFCLIGGEGDTWWNPPIIMPEMLPLVQLTAEQIERIVQSVPGGAANVQDIYPLAPLQEGILFHHLMGGEGDPYLLGFLVSFDSRMRLDAYLGAMQAVVDRHDILRTAVVWEGVPEPVQVVWRKAALPVEEVALDAGAGDAGEQLYARFDPRRHRMDLRLAPWLRVYIAHDQKNDRWLMLQLQHHLAGDHSTLEVMQEEIQAHLLGQANRLAAPLPFRNLVAQARLGVSREEHEAFFRQLLGDVEEPTAPFGLLDVWGDGSGIEEARIAVDASLAGRMREQARKLRVSVASVCHVAWAQVLARVSGREDVVFGTVLFGRMQGGAGMDRAMGLFINTLPVRIRVGEEGAGASVQHTHALLGDLLRHEHASLALAQRCSGVPATAPLFTALLNYRHSPGAGQAPSADSKRAWEGIQGLYGQGRTNYPFMLSVDDLGDQFWLTAQVKGSVEPKRVCKYMHTALGSLVAALESEPGKAARSLEVLPQGERSQLLYEWNATEREYPRDTCVHELFEEQVRKIPDATAVMYEERQLSYGELNGRANRLAHYLQSLGVQPDDRVAICVERGLEMVMALLGILKTGAAYVPLDPNYPSERLAFMLQDSKARVLITRQSLADRIPQVGIKKICFETDLESVNERGAPPPTPVTAADPAYVMYTSGSTGRPKGVIGTHRATVNRLFWMWKKFPFQSDEICCQKTSLNFVDSVWEIFGPLLAGVPSVIIPDDEVKHVDALIEVLARNHVTRIVLVPSLLRAILSAPKESLEKLAELGFWICSGEALPPDLAQNFLDLMPGRTLLNLYGSTEVAADATFYEVRREHGQFSIPIGRPISNTRAYVLDAQQQMVPVNVQGEIYIGGDAVARGYLNQPELTAERFLADPYASEPGARMYKTGDLGRWLADGNIEFLGRNDFQAKVRGYRIELGEIEAAMREHTGVRDAVVVARKDACGDERLVAYYTSAEMSEESEGDVGAEELRTHLLAKLPGYMVPAGFVRLERLPLTPTGKIDRQSLPAASVERSQGQEGFIAPRDEFEQMLTRLWAKILEVSPIGVNENFFELGGHSLLAVRMMVEIDRLFQRRLPLATLVQAPTIAQLAELLRRENWIPSWRSLVPMQPGGSKLPLFLMHAHGGNVLEYQALVNHLDSDQPVYALQSLGLDGCIRHESSIEQMAADYLQEIRSLQSEGPYLLGGFCFGGLLALEAAQQLKASGHQVPLLILIQTTNPEFARFAPDIGLLRQYWYRTAKRLDLELENLSYRGARYVRERLVDACATIGSKAAIAFDRVIGNRRQPHQNASMRYVLESLRMEHAKAYTKYMVRPYLGDVLLIRARKQLPGLSIDPTLGWKEVVQGCLHVCEVPGHQQNMLIEPNVDHLAHALTAHLHSMSECIGLKRSEHALQDPVPLLS
jgi:amino acid adenylation domain-containing protein